MTVFAIGVRRTNAQLMADCHELGYITAADDVLDCTYGLGRFWREWCPTRLTCSDLNPRGPLALTGAIHRWDFTQLPIVDRRHDVVVFDPPYKLNGTSTGQGAATSDESYGVHLPASWQDRHTLIYAGIGECVRVCRLNGLILVKCQDQVCSGAVRWQTRLFADHAEQLGCILIDQLHVHGSRPQPEGRDQVHARRDYSTLLACSAAPPSRTPNSTCSPWTTCPPPRSLTRSNISATRSTGSAPNSTDTNAPRTSEPPDHQCGNDDRPPRHLAA